MNRSWEKEGHDRMTAEQRRLLNAACGDLAEQVIWHGHRLSKDDYRHLVSGTILGMRSMPSVNMGDTDRGFIMLGGSSLDLSKSQATLAIHTVFAIGDQPEDQGLKARPVRWCQVVRLARGMEGDEALEFECRSKGIAA